MTHTINLNRPQDYKRRGDGARPKRLTKNMGSEFQICCGWEDGSLSVTTMTGAWHKSGFPHELDLIYDPQPITSLEGKTWADVASGAIKVRRKDDGTPVEECAALSDGQAIIRYVNGARSWVIPIDLKNFEVIPPAPKRVHGWMNVYPPDHCGRIAAVFDTKAKADAFALAGRIDCICIDQPIEEPSK